MFYLFCLMIAGKELGLMELNQIQFQAFTILNGFSVLEKIMLKIVFFKAMSKQ